MTLKKKMKKYKILQPDLSMSFAFIGFISVLFGISIIQLHQWEIISSAYVGWGIFLIGGFLMMFGLLTDTKGVRK